MTAICGGGSSGPNPGLDAVLTFSSGRIIQLLVKAGLSEFSVVLPFIGTIPAVLSGFCSSDPPSMTALTSDEADAVLGLQIGADFFSGLGKLKDIILNLIWLDVCQCTSGTLTPPTPPATPSTGPVFVPPQPDLTPVLGPWYPMQIADCKILTLGGGSPARPALWYTWGFDDSAWTTPVPPTGFLLHGSPPFFWPDWSQVTGYQFGANAPVNTSLPGLADVLAPADPMPHNYEQFLIRWKVYIGDVTPGAGVMRVGSIQETDGGWSSGAIWVNGAQSIAPGSALNAQTAMGRIIPNAWNMFGLDVNPSNTGSANTWGSHGGVYLGLDWSVTQAPLHQTACCPPDVTTQAYLDSIMQMVTLIQRQAVPFAYVYGDNHVALTGDGEIAPVSGLLGVSIDVTTIPSTVGSAIGTPQHLFDVGYVTLGTSDGWLRSRRIDADGTLEIATPGVGAITRVGYTLAPGVEIDLRELIRES